MVIFYYSDIHILQKKMKKINVGIIGRNFGYKVIYKALKNRLIKTLVSNGYKGKFIVPLPNLKIS